MTTEHHREIRDRKVWLPICLIFWTQLFCHFLAADDSRNPAAATRKANIIETEIISQQPQLGHGPPTMVRRASGALVLVYSGGRDFHVCPFGRLEMTTSCDNGPTWKMPRVPPNSALDHRDAALLETSLRPPLISVAQADSPSTARISNNATPVITSGLSRNSVSWWPADLSADSAGDVGIRIHLRDPGVFPRARE